MELPEREHEALRRLADSIGWDDAPLSVNGKFALEYGLRFSSMRRECAA